MNVRPNPKEKRQVPQRVIAAAGVDLAHAYATKAAQGTVWLGKRLAIFAASAIISKAYV